MKSVRLATLNLWNDTFDREQRLERTAAWIRAAELDVLCVQENVATLEWNTVQRLGELSGMPLVTPHEGASTAVFSRLDATNGRLIDLSSAVPGTLVKHAAACDVHTPLGVLPVVSVHLVWGSLGETARLAQLQALVGMFNDVLGSSDDEEPAIIAGDFNAEDHAESLRYLQGLTAHQPPTLWTDAWCRPADGQLDGTTSSGSNEYAVVTAATYRTGRSAVRATTFLPNRRIDFIFSRGWRHGRVFSPFDTRVVRDPLMSDHYAVVTELLLG
jgi:endonuclease/exonuclease/phosphatase family metal-dependent hydrolase